RQIWYAALRYSCHQEPSADRGPGSAAGASDLEQHPAASATDSYNVAATRSKEVGRNACSTGGGAGPPGLARGAAGTGGARVRAGTAGERRRDSRRGAPRELGRDLRGGVSR